MSSPCWGFAAVHEVVVDSNSGAGVGEVPHEELVDGVRCHCAVFAGVLAVGGVCGG